MKHLAAISTLIAIAILLGIAAPAFAVDFPAFPMAFWGNATINGASAPAGSIIRAYYGSELAGEVTLQEAGIYGYDDSAKQKLTVKEGTGIMKFTIQRSGSTESGGTNQPSHPAFTEGETINKNLSFTLSSSGGSGGGGGGGGGSTAPTNTATPTPTPGTSTTPAPSATGLGGTGNPAALAAHDLHEGQVISAVGSSDPDIYIVNAWGYKRLFLNPIIFSFYGHLGGWSVVTGTPAVARDAFITSGIFRNCETNDERVFAVEVTGEDTGTLHHIQMSGAQVAAEDPDFFHRIFCINNNEFNWYSKSPTPYTSLSQIPYYRR